MYNLLVVNILILISIMAFYFEIMPSISLFFLLAILLTVNMIIIYNKSNSFDKSEEKKKIMLHKIKNSLSTIMGYNEAFNDNLIDKKELDDNLNAEIENIIAIIKDEIYRK